MSTLDLNLLTKLHAVLSEGSVAGAAQRLGLSASATSRALARLREATGDPLLVRAGRGLVPTPRALELRERVGPLVRDAEAILRPAEKPDLAQVVRTFSLQSREGFVENFGPSLITRIADEAPGVLLRFVQKTSRDTTTLRDGTVDLETGVVGRATGPEVRAQTLFRDRFVGVVRLGHPFTEGEITPARYAAARHVSLDGIARPLEVDRRIAAVVSGFSAALAVARASDLIATVPERQTGNLRTGMYSFALPVQTPAIAISMLWHPRLDADPVHRWLRGCLRAVCAEEHVAPTAVGPGQGET